jgi:hypothetical protein
MTRIRLGEVSTKFPLSFLFEMVARDGIEPPALAFSGLPSKQAN